MNFEKQPEWGKRFDFPENVQIEYNGLSGSVASEIVIKMVERYENAVIEQIAMEAKLAGVASCTALNKAAILEAIEKQIPQAVELTENCCFCPNCRFDMMGVYDFTTDDTKDPQYCPECGQALDWGNGNG